MEQWEQDLLALLLSDHKTPNELSQAFEDVKAKIEAAANEWGITPEEVFRSLRASVFKSREFND